MKFTLTLEDRDDGGLKMHIAFDPSIDEIDDVDELPLAGRVGVDILSILDNVTDGKLLADGDGEQ